MVRQSSITLASECSVAERAAMTQALEQAGFTGAHLELGTAAGGTLKELMGIYPDAATRPPFHVIDPMTYFPDQLTKVRTNLTNAGIDPDSVRFHIGTSADFLPVARAEGLRFDFVFIDGDHRHRPVLADLALADFVTPGGLIALHDNGPKFPGVGWAIDRFLARNPGYERVTQAETLTLLRKTPAAGPVRILSTELAEAGVTQVLSRWRQSYRKRLARRA